MHTSSYKINDIIERNSQNGSSVALTQNRVALLKPIFTATAYANAFYRFYSKYISLPVGEYVTTDLDFLNRTVVDEWKWSAGLYD